MDVMEPAFPSSAVETGRYDCMVAADSAHMRCVSYQIGIQTENGEKLLTVRSVPKLTRPLPQLQALTEIVRDYRLPSNGEPGILIGIDYF
ncbi:hypothetical protein KIN20_010602 [Parelaphostrongylus tenuis]|uniref:Uncharacterized protein n=1 Tax=Parelaphostrongylus tenuis TaxID=148309 RepID=A0AAD5MQU0_PARTN|nr:hypothetical protein KIN20_010602 [Parelaphostrongylus tenuis]